MPTQQGNVVGHNDNLYEYENISGCLVMWYGKEALQEIDRTRRHNALANWHHEDEDTTLVHAEDDEILEIREDPNEWDVDEEPDLEEPYAMAQDAARNFQQATKLVQQDQTARNYFPVDRRMNQKGSPKGQKRASRRASRR